MGNAELVVALRAREAADASRFGPKAANLARLAHAGLATPGGFCIDAAAYRAQLAALGLEATALAVSSPDAPEARRAAIAMKLALFDDPVDAAIRAPLVAAWREHSAHASAGMAVRSSALVEDRFGASFAGQFDSYLGLETEDEFDTAVRSCWAALWSTRVLRYMAAHDASPAQTAMAILVQPLVNARVSGGALSRNAAGDMVINAAPGLGSSIAQGEVVPERIVLGAGGELREKSAAREHAALRCAHGRRGGVFTTRRCLDDAEAVALGRVVRQVEDLMAMPVEIEWALDDAGFKLLQARPLHLETAPVPDALWQRHPGLTGHPGGVGWGSGRACVVECECELPRVAAGDVLVTRAAGPALGQVLPRVAAVVSELGGSTSHLASLARERGIPMVLGVLDATRRIPEGVQVAVDGVAGVVRWVR
ncbi:MAG TPA: PEP/pyruvate-binding domain-containing protein [Usitatibacter sp.]|nr:PEP/pyruvate-binding domain-containing protein [Usitatibacter sp.]